MIGIIQIIVVVIIIWSMSNMYSTEAGVVNNSSPTPTPTPWPQQFHATVFRNSSGALQMNDLWYDWPNGRNLNVEQDQLAEYPISNVEWTNGSSFFFYRNKDDFCQLVEFDVGILRPNWMEGGNYLGQRHMDGFLCNVWEKADGFIWYYEDVLTNRPVYWLLFSGAESHFMTFEVGAVLEDAMWQAPSYCFEDNKLQKKSGRRAVFSARRSFLVDEIERAIY